jgi:hypothetical protein
MISNNGNEQVKITHSLCIPRVNSYVGKEDIINRFNELDIGNVSKVDMINKKNENGTTFYSAFVHINWNNSELSNYIINRVTEGKDVKIIYDGFLFWKVYLNKSTKTRNYNYGKSCDGKNCDAKQWERNSKILF